MTDTTTAEHRNLRRDLRRALLKLAKSGWVLLVFGGVLLVLITNWDTFTAQLRAVAAWRIALAALLLLGGKLLLVELSCQSVRVTGTRIPYRRMFLINAMSQLAKYLPGSVWQFLGRAGYYAGDGLSAVQITRAMITENLWLVISAFSTGGIALSLQTGDSRVLFAPFLLLLWAVILFVLLRQTPGTTWRVVVQVLLLQIAMWSLMGAMLWALIPLEAGSIPGFGLLVIGALALSWAIGFITIFAPGGLGVREAVLTALLGVAIDPTAALVYAALSRVVWVLVELSLGIAARHPVFNRTPTP